MKPIKMTGHVALMLIPKPDKSTVHSTDIMLDVDERCDQKMYFENGLPTKEGTKILTQCFIQGLVANIHAAEAAGFWKDHEHLRYVISELERGFVQIGEVKEGVFR